MWALVLTFGLAVFVLVARVEPGNYRPLPAVWILATVLCVAVVLGCVVGGARTEGRRRAVLIAAAVGVPDKIYGEEVVCYVVAKDKSLTEQAVIEHCGQFLPPAKTPKQVTIVPELPKSDRGKVLRDRLRDDWIARHKVSA